MCPYGMSMAMLDADAEVSQVSMRKRRSGTSLFSRSQISVACLLSERVLKSMHDSVSWGVCLQVGGGGVLGVNWLCVFCACVVGEILHTKRQWMQEKATSVLCGVAQQQGGDWRLVLRNRRNAAEYHWRAVGRRSVALSMLQAQTGADSGRQTCFWCTLAPAAHIRAAATIK